MEKINLELKDYNTQRDNDVKAFVACMPSSYKMFLKGNKIEYVNDSIRKFGRWYEDDDYFMLLLNTPDAKAYCYKKYPWAYSTDPNKIIPPNQIHGMYGSYLSPIICGKKVSDFIENSTFESIKTRIDNNEVIMTSGSFPTAHIDGHAFCIVGYRKDKLLLGDPFGNFHTNYKDVNGYLVEMSKDEFLQHVKPLKIANSTLYSTLKWSHIKV